MASDPSRFIKWRSVIPQKLLQDDLLKEVLNSSPESAQYFLRDIYQHSKSNLRGEIEIAHLITLVTTSRFSWPQWISAYLYFKGQMGHYHAQRNCIEIFKYIECCLYSPEAQIINQNLVELVRINLETFGIK